MEECKSPLGGGYLSASAIRLYGRYAQGGPIEHGPEHDELTAWHLVAMEDGRPVTREPRDTLRRHVIEQLAVLQEQAALIASVPTAIDELTTHFQRGRKGGGCEYLAQREIVNARIAEVVDAAEAEILAAQPGGPRTRQLMDVAIRRDTAALRRGVSMRTLYRDSVRQHPVTREWAQVMSAQGGRYGTLAGPFQRCILVDRKTAFIEDLVVGASPNAGWMVTDRAMVAFIQASFEEWWRRAEPWHGRLQEVVEPGEVRTTRLQREILRDTAAGITQQVTAARLGMCVRSLQRQLEQLREMWGATTLAALTYQWVLSPDYQVDDQPLDAVSGQVEQAAVSAVA